jgi:hypothetical protein
MSSDGSNIFYFMLGPSGFTRMAVLHINKTYYSFMWKKHIYKMEGFIVQNSVECDKIC